MAVGGGVLYPVRRGAAGGGQRSGRGFRGTNKLQRSTDYGTAVSAPLNAQSKRLNICCMYVCNISHPARRNCELSHVMPVHTCLHCAFDRSVTIIVLKQSFRLSPRGPASVSARVGSASGLPVSGSAVTGERCAHWTLPAFEIELCH